jgi:hypothetical protein
MTVAFYMDVHIPMAITRHLRLRGVDVVTANEDGANTLADDVLLERASALNRVMFTHDIRFKALAENWQRDGKSFAGLIYGHAEGASIGQYVRDVELIAKACEPSELANMVIHLPM